MTIAEFLEAIANYDGENLEPVKIHLKCNNALINKEYKGLNPLMTALRNKNCSSKLVKLLFLFGANSNYMEINPRINCSFGPLCTALQNVQSVEVIEVLLDTWKFPKDACKEHLADMHCIMSCPNSRLKEDLFKLFINRGQNIDNDGKLFLCKALKYCTEACDIELLLNAGASLNGCIDHVSALDCATNSNAPVLLKADVLEVLIHAGAVCEPTANCLTPLERALLYRKYEIKAIKLLFNLSVMDLSKERFAHLLHLAVQNASCTMSAITLLLDYGAPLNIPNGVWVEGNTELHDAVANGGAQPSIIELLVKSGSDVNAVNDYGHTPLIIVARSFYFLSRCSSQHDIATILLRAGARIDVGHDCNDYGDHKCLAFITLIRVWVFSCINECENAFECVKLLVKYLFLQCPKLEVHTFVVELCDKNLLKKIDEIECHVSADTFFRGLKFFKERLLDFTRECICEQRLMCSICVADDLSLLDLISGDSMQDFGENAEYEFVKLLSIMSVIELPIFFDEIACKVDRGFMETKVQEIQIYTIKNCPRLPCAKKKVILNYESIQKITSYLSDVDFLKLIVAFYKLTYPIDNEPASANFIERKVDAWNARRFEQSQFLESNENILPQKLSVTEAREICLNQIPYFFPE